MSDLISRAQQFIAEHGRPLDRARFAFHFTGGPLSEFLSALAAYQNPDGGFGGGLELDIAAPDSQPFAVEIALEYLQAAGVPASHPMLQKVVAYLEATQPEDGCWRFTPAIYAHSLAPWFSSWTFPNLNPACSTAGFLLGFGLGSPRLHARVRALFERLADVKAVAEGDFYAVRAYMMYFLPESDLPQREFYLSGLLWWLIRQHYDGGLADNGHWFEYIRSPHSWLGKRIPASILRERLDLLTAEIQPDGGWPTPYNPAWRSPVTINNLLLLQRFGRL